MDQAKRLSVVLSLLALLGGPSPAAFAAASGTSEGVKSEFEYPELLVTPRASERIESEAKMEADRRWTNFLPIQVSALSTMTAGVFQLADPNLSKDPDKISGIAGVAVGGGWLAVSGVLMATYQPYSSARAQIGDRPKSQREQLARERFSEEAIKHAARTGRILTWLSSLTNLGVNVYMLAQSQPDSFSRVVDGAAAALSLAPLVFKFHWQDVNNEQEDYKKRIYAPIAAGAAVFNDAAGRGPIPGVALSFSL